MTGPTTDPRDGQPCAANVDTATVDGRAAVMAALAVWREAYERHGDPTDPKHLGRALAAAYDAYMVAPKPATVDGADLRAAIVAAIHAGMARSERDAIRRIVHWPGLIADRILAALTAAGWPDSYQPDNPHVAAAREARAEVERLRRQVASIAYRVHEALMARADYTRSQILDDLRRLVPDGPMPATNTAQPLYVDHEGKPTGEPRIDVTASVYLVPADDQPETGAEPWRATDGYCTATDHDLSTNRPLFCRLNPGHRAPHKWAFADATETGADDAR